MRLGILTGDDGWGDDDRPYAGNEIVGGQLRRIQRLIRKKGAHALMANSVLAGVFVEIVGKAYEPF